VIVDADIGADHVRTSLPVYAFRVYGWSLLLAGRSYGDDWPVPKGAVVRTSCIMAFGPHEGDGTYMFAPHCRSRRK
jgi:hypothetical protein